MARPVTTLCIDCKNKTGKNGKAERRINSKHKFIKEPLSRGFFISKLNIG